jgi:lysyl-tRNA synthetase class 2
MESKGEVKKLYLDEISGEMVSKNELKFRKKQREKDEKKTTKSELDPS